jgi:hypothetical protein
VASNSRWSGLQMVKAPVPVTYAPLAPAMRAPLNFGIRYQNILQLLLFALLIAPGAATSASDACPQPQSLYPSPKVTSQEILDLIKSVKLRPGTHCRAFAQNQVQCNSDSLPELWWFTEPGHPAYPSASRGQMMRNDATGAVCLLRDGYFAGAEAPFAAWMDWLKKYDQATIDRVVGHPFPTT